jgi:hypothetical protein
MPWLGRGRYNGRYLGGGDIKKEKRKKVKFVRKRKNEGSGMKEK